MLARARRLEDALTDLLRMVVLGTVQGLTEFLPVSSSGHLILARELFGWELTDDLTFDVALHLGTTAAVLGFFWREWLSMARSALRWAAGNGRSAREGAPYDARLLFLLAIGSIPAALAGLLFEDVIEDRVRSPLVVGAMLLAFGVLLLAAERLGRRRRGIGRSGWIDAVLVGCAQAVALVPGVSRSGVTITAGMFRDLHREDAARFSFLLSTPVIVGAGVLQIAEALAGDVSGGDFGLMAVGAVVAAATGWLAIAGLLRLVRASSYVPFVAYRFVLGVFVLAWFAV